MSTSAKVDARMVVLLSLRSLKVCRIIPADDSLHSWLTEDESGIWEARDMQLTSITRHETRMLPRYHDEVVFHLRNNLNPRESRRLNMASRALDETLIEDRRRTETTRSTSSTSPPMTSYRQAAVSSEIWPTLCLAATALYQERLSRLHLVHRRCWPRYSKNCARPTAIVVGRMARWCKSTPCYQDLD